jgi:hypothetical protein
LLVILASIGVGIPLFAALTTVGFFLLSRLTPAGPRPSPGPDRTASRDDDRPKLPPGRTDETPGDGKPDAPAPPISRFAIKTAPLDGDKKTIDLPAAADDLVVGGAGRYLILRIPSKKQLAVFDANEAQIVKYLSVPDDNTLCAAGLDKLIAVFPNSKMIRRYDLTTFEQEVQATLPLPGTHTALMGAASRGPLLLSAAEEGVGATTKIVLVDPAALKGIDVDFTLTGAGGFGLGSVSRVSGDGGVFTTFLPDTSTQMHTIVEVNGRTLKQRTLFESRMQVGDGGNFYGHLTPSPEGRFVYTTRGPFTAEGHQVGGDRVLVGPELEKSYSLPAAEGETFYLTLEVPGPPIGDENTPAGLHLNLVGDPKPIAALKQPGALLGVTFMDRDRPGWDRRLLLIPSAQLLVVWRPKSDKLELYRVDAHELLAKSGRDFLYVSSQSPVEATKGAVFRCLPEVKSSKGGVRVRLESGPEGMEAGPDGALTWPVPADFDAPETFVILSVTDASSREIQHALKVVIKE